MTNWKPLFYVLIITFAIGVIFNLILGSFDVDLTIPNPDSPISTNTLFLFQLEFISSNIFDVIDIELFGFSIPLPSFNIFAISGTIQTFVISQMIILTYVPVIILIPFIVIFIFAVVWTTIKLFIP